MHSDLAQLGVYYQDWHVGNHLEAPASPPGLRGEASPYTNRIYTMRVVDFEHAKRSNTPAKYLLFDVDISVAEMTCLEYPWRGE